jgi:hypothetical protein
MSVRTAAAAVLTALASLCAAPAFAGQREPPPLESRPLVSSQFPIAITPEQLQDLATWSREYDAWKKWFSRFRNRPEPGVFRSRPRRPRPDPPDWAAHVCSFTVEEDGGPLGEGCRRYRDWRRNDYAALVMAEKISETRADREAPQKTVWWQHIHVDGLWPMAQTGSSAFGVFGTHATLQLSDRVQVFLAPGAILMRIPTRDGGHAWSGASDWGFSYRIVDFKMPGLRRLSTLHLNIARVWLLGSAAQRASGDIYLAGCSLTFKARPRSSKPR